MRRRYKLTRRGMMTLICLAVLLTCALLLGLQKAQDKDIARQNEHYRSLHTAAALPSPAATPLPQPDDDTLRIPLPTEPPRDGSFAMLSAINPDVCGWLTAGAIDLPVVHRINDNETYLSVNLSGEESPGGTLFVDGFNRLYPADTLTVIYGHNMHSGDMFGSLSLYLDPEYMAGAPIVQFDTLYGPGKYVPFAVFQASVADVDIRQFQPTVEEFNRLTDLCRALSAYDCGVDVRFGDRLLALVTCDGKDDERLFVLCRALRDGESETDFVPVPKTSEP